MPRSQTIATICHDGQFWIALVERLSDGRIEIARHVFGPEPSNAELLAWAGEGFANLRFVPAEARALPEPPVNPKRRKRMAAAQARAAGPSSRAKDALKVAAELTASRRKMSASERRQAVAVQRYDDRVARRKARKRGKH